MQYFVQQELFPQKMLSSSDRNVSETFQKTETFSSSEDWEWAERTSGEDEYELDW